MLPQEMPAELRTKYQNCFPMPIVAIARDLGLEIYETGDFENTQSGSIVKEGDKYIIYINSHHAPTRKRFSIAHEIGHFLKHRAQLDKGQEMIDYIVQTAPNGEQPHHAVALHRKTDHDMTEEERKQEQAVNAFAAELLMPEEEFRKIFEKSNTIEEIAGYFNVSASAATIRAKSLFGVFMT
jgi:Zn-dependent peptidase ImmA (M78 family)